jgi:hypothetical protein
VSYRLDPVQQLVELLDLSAAGSFHLVPVSPSL